MPSPRSTSPNIQYCPWCPQVIAFPLAPNEAMSCLSTLTEHVMRHHLGRLLDTEACIKIDSPHVDTHGPGDTGSGGGFGKAYIPDEYIYAYMCPVRKVFMNVYRDPMDGMWYRLRLRCGCAQCVDEAGTEQIKKKKKKVERNIGRDALADEVYWADEEDVARQKGMEQGAKGVSESGLDAKNGAGGWGGNGGIPVGASAAKKGGD
ncbi:hypothetical protein C7212DRAFT_336467 [Tuber magnatum]|uniref:Uncharacterized protein n=1 Tax=Tuber magnatum TaxID=42249 RepID=A0A317SCS5_9PEZI|nr:hypothetical protein C7212DRAFT_336467 [Tuber magnatum]